MKKSDKIPDFKNDREISDFMEKHDGFELMDQGLAEIEKTPIFTKKTEIQLDLETLQLLQELVATGICDNQNEAIIKAIRSYVLAVLPQSYKLVKGRHTET